MKLFRKGTRRAIVPGAGHFVPRERPEVVVEAIRDVIIEKRSFRAIGDK
jgi:pimeloyl-ACP methyl ester carboxylesterase